MDEMEYGTVKYTISKLIDKLSFAEHTAGTLQAENDRLRQQVGELEEECETYRNLFDAQFDATAKLEKLYKEKTGEEAPFMVF